MNKSGLSLSTKLKPVLVALHEAYEYAEDTRSDLWEFAVPISHLFQLGVSVTDLRWLVRKGLVEHAREVTVEGDNGRQFRRTGDLTFAELTCFVITESGVYAASSLRPDDSPPVQQTAPESDDEAPPKNGKANGHAFSAEAHYQATPHWDSETRELSMEGKIVKRFKWPAHNQEFVLSAFEEEGWTRRIDDPLPPQPEQDSKRRLSDTIKCLNRKQSHRLIHFRGDGTGEGIIWEIADVDF